MGIFDAINPFKKKEDLGLPPLDDKGMPGNPMGDDPLGGNDFNMGHQDMNPMPPGSTPQFGHPASHGPGFSQDFGQQHPQDDARMTMPLGESMRQDRITAMHGSSDSIRQVENPLKKDMELISSKLDYLKASLEAINSRLANLEHMARQEQDSRKW